MNIISVLTLFIPMFLMVIALIAVVKKCSVEEATSIGINFCKRVLKALFEETPVSEKFYPVCIGWDGNRIVLQLVDDEFSKVRDNFASCYCINVIYSQDGSLVRYDFDIMRKQNSMDDEYLEKLVQKQVEETLARTMRRYDYYLPTEPLTHVELSANELCVIFARNDTGVKTLDNRKRMVRRRKIEATTTCHTNMTEKWDDKE